MNTGNPRAGADQNVVPVEDAHGKTSWEQAAGVAAATAQVGHITGYVEEDAASLVATVLDA